MSDLQFNFIPVSATKTLRGSVTYVSRFFCIILFASSVLFFSCQREDMFSFADNGAEKKYTIGDTGPGGGIVFYITDGGLHGMEAAQSNQSTSQDWIAPTICQSTANGNTFTSIGTGRTNTDAIILQASHTYSAAQLCIDYFSGGFNDWFLPSKDELHLMYTNLKLAGLGGFAASGYWSSSEFDSSQGWNENFTDGTRYNYGKSSTSYVRAIRSF